MQQIKLTPRRQQILKIVITEYTRTAQPISSKELAEKHGLGVSSSTIRNDLAALEKQGLLTHPHTSAGRIPTDAGYRYFVENLLSGAVLPSEDKIEIRNAFGLARQELDQWLRVSTSVLANISQSAAIATAPRAIHTHFKHVELVAIHDTKVLLVLVLQAGTVKQQLLDLDQQLGQSELSKISNELNDLLESETATGIARLMPKLSPFAQQVATLIVELMSSSSGRSERQFYRDGLARMLDEPEFAEGDNVRSIVQVLEERSLFEQVVNEYDVGQYGIGANSAGQDNGDENLQVIIAGNGRYAELETVSLIVSRYGVVDSATGYLGVVGPLRMSYGRTIGAVRFVATLMSNMVQDMHGSTEQKVDS